ncbi:MAG: hypothetical protein PHW04_06835 [Candidatus Wallbacteria bacterium]|nr:hypothetical protein [Candidatus Wallbacteria bacterium]
MSSEKTYTALRKNQPAVRKGPELACRLLAQAGRISRYRRMFWLLIALISAAALAAAYNGSVFTLEVPSNVSLGPETAFSADPSLALYAPVRVNYFWQVARAAFYQALFVLMLVIIFTEFKNRFAIKMHFA